MERRIIELLLDPSAYTEPTREVTLIQTHVSLIFLTDTHAYKVKKAVNLGFLDFTTLELRRFFCNEEVRLNRRLSPDIYLGVVEVRNAPGAPFGQDGELLDYAVRMVRLPEERMLNRMLARGEVSEEQIREIGRVVGRFHLEAERTEETNRYGSPDIIRGNWEENFRQLQELRPEQMDRDDLAAIQTWVCSFMTDHEQLFLRRVREGYVRDCDGDLHTENICLAEKIYIFDCIEFNSRFRFSDTAADVAFLLMDLEYSGRPDLSRILLQEYLEVTGDDALRSLLDFYRCYRAIVRAKVESMKLADPLIPDHAKGVASARVSRYFRLALGYTLRNRLPLTLWITCGLMGAGKTRLAEELALELGLETFSSDRIRKDLARVSQLSRHYCDYETGIYGPELTAATYDALLGRAEESLSAGRSVIVDGSFRSARERERFRALAAAHGARFFILFATAPEEVIEERLKSRESAGTEVSDGRWELYRRQQAEFQPLGEDEGEKICLDTSLPLNDNMRMIHSRMVLP